MARFNSKLKFKPNYWDAYIGNIENVEALFSMVFDSFPYFSFPLVFLIFANFPGEALHNNNTSSPAPSVAVPPPPPSSIRLTPSHSMLGGMSSDDPALHAALNSMAQQPASTAPKRAHIPAWLGASPLGRTSMTQEFDGQLAALEVACAKATFPLDSEKPRNYLSKVAFPVPSWYGQVRGFPRHL